MGRRCHLQALGGASFTLSLHLAPKSVLPKGLDLGTILVQRYVPTLAVCHVTNWSQHASLDGPLGRRESLAPLPAFVPSRNSFCFLRRFWRHAVLRAGRRRSGSPGTRPERKQAEEVQARVHRAGSKARSDSHAGRPRSGGGQEISDVSSFGGEIHRSCRR